MAELKTKEASASVAAYLDAIEEPGRRADCVAISTLMQRVTKTEPKMWGPSIVGFGSYHKTCLYIRRLSEIKMPVLERLIKESVAEMRKRHPS